MRNGANVSFASGGTGDPGTPKEKMQTDGLEVVGTKLSNSK